MRTSMSIETETYICCDGCGKEIYNEDYTVLCDKCSIEEIPSLSVSEYCYPVNFGNVYTCKIKRQDFEWIGELPEYCPRCGRPIK